MCSLVPRLGPPSDFKSWLHKEEVRKRESNELALPNHALHSKNHLGELVRRGGRATAGTGETENEASGWGAAAAVSERDLDRPDQDEGYDDKEGDSKAMRLTLMEEVLLLGIKDREVGL